MGFTMAEKILARASDRDEAYAGEYVTAQPDYIMGHESAVLAYHKMLESGTDSFADSSRIVVLFDHITPPSDEKGAMVHQVGREMVEKHGIKHFFGERAGICHQVMVEKGFVAPGRLIVGADSHTTTYGAFGCASTGLGMSEVGYLMNSGETWFRVPETVKIVMNGTPSRYTMGKDIILHLAGLYSLEVARYKSIEFQGSSVSQLTLADRMSISNMSVELGAKFGMFLPDKLVADYLRGRVIKDFDTVLPDKDASYTHTIELDISELGPQVACHPRIDNVVGAETLADISVDQVFLGSCTNGRLEDLQAAAEILEGRKVDRRTRMIVTPASYEVYKEAMRAGIMETLIDAGAVITHPSCGPCFSGHYGYLTDNEVCLSTTNRNFPGRMGSPKSKIYLANPHVAAASAVTGKISHPDEL